LQGGVNLIPDEAMAPLRALIALLNCPHAIATSMARPQSRQTGLDETEEIQDVAKCTEAKQKRICSQWK